MPPKRQDQITLYRVVFKSTHDLESGGVFEREKSKPHFMKTR
jgi:hypothetical protein